MRSKVISPPWHRQPGLIVLALVGAVLLACAFLVGGIFVPLAAFALMLILLGALFSGGSGWRPTSAGWQRMDRGSRIGLLTVSVLALVGLLVLQAVGRPVTGLDRSTTADRGASSDPPVWVPAPVIKVVSAPTDDEEETGMEAPDPTVAKAAEAADAAASAGPSPMTRSTTSQPSAGRPPSSKAPLAPGEVCVCDVTGTPDDRASSTATALPVMRTTIGNALSHNQRTERLSLTLDDGTRHDLSVSPQQPQRQATLSLTQASGYSLAAEMMWHDGSQFILRGSGWIDPRLARRWQVSLLQDGGIPYALRLAPLP